MLSIAQSHSEHHFPAPFSKLPELIRVLLYRRGAVHRLCQHAPKGLGTTKTEEEHSVQEHEARLPTIEKKTKQKAFKYSFLVTNLFGNNNFVGTRFYSAVNRTGLPQNEVRNNSISAWFLYCHVNHTRSPKDNGSVAITPLVIGLYCPVSRTGHLSTTHTHTHTHTE